MRVCVATCLLAIVGTMLAVPALPSDTTTATPTADCPCLTNGGQPGPGACVCDVEGCFSRCVDEECPGTPNCMLDCTFRCGCQANESLPLCLTHIDPGPTPYSHRANEDINANDNFPAWQRIGQLLDSCAQHGSCPTPGDAVSGPARPSCTAQTAERLRTCLEIPASPRRHAVDD